ncbi:MAG: alpha/beta fold hydrolase [Phycisphaerales bacterium]|nr:alpha/beta fold hydrolase [Phycisphaerae bacterium]NNM26712.1 alpha/beta fold hydrolase [Phycisphaerales bacterium]
MATEPLTRRTRRPAVPAGLLAVVAAAMLFAAPPATAAPLSGGSSGCMLRSWWHEITRLALTTRESVRSWFTELLAPPPAATRAYGIRFVTDAETTSPPERYLARNPAPESVVILIHGLDDPGWLWRDTIAAVREAGHVVARMEYPNDGPISDAADRFANELRALRRHGVRQVDIVGHSMGGLVTRDVLTRDEHYGGDAAGSDELPRVRRFVMCGTPNHGAPIARLRGVSEVKEQLTRVLRGNGDWRGGFADGRGEAGADLLPGSAFLEDLNSRPPPRNVRTTIVAGRMQPLPESDLAAVGRAVRDAADSVNAPRWLRRWLADVDAGSAELLDALADGLGDGCVTVESARLPWADELLVVTANHLSMIASIGPKGGEPPAIPIILERLRGEAE